MPAFLAGASTVGVSTASTAATGLFSVGLLSFTETSSAGKRESAEDFWIATFFTGVIRALFGLSSSTLFCSFLAGADSTVAA
ncbi:hypothetical protein D3C84_184210 [compost metagenome]